MEALAVTAAIAVGLLVARLLFPLFFDDGEEFYECICRSFTPGLLSLLRGELLDDLTKSIRLNLYFTVAGLAGVVTHHGITAAMTGLLSRFGA